MTARDLFAFATRALRGHRMRTALTLLGVAIGVGAVVLLTALGDGARRYVIGQFESLGSNLLAVIPGKTETTGGAAFMNITTRDLTLGDSQALLRVPEVARVAPMTMGSETVSHGDRRRQVAIVGATDEFLEVRRLRLGRGRFLPPGDLRRGVAVVVLGATVARELFPADDALGSILRIGDVRARVVGILAPQGTQLGLNLDEIVVIPVARAMRLFNRRSLFRILVEVRAHADLTRAKEQLITVLKQRHDGEEDVTVITQDAVLASFSNILQTLTLAVAAIAAVSLAVAGIGIMNVMLVSVTERTAEVGLLRAVGVGRRQVTGVFLAEAALLSLTGGVLGLGIGLLGVWVLVQMYPALPARPPLWAVGSALGLALVVGLVFGLIPARRAAALDPVTALGRR